MEFYPAVCCGGLAVVVVLFEEIVGVIEQVIDFREVILGQCVCVRKKVFHDFLTF